MVGTQGRFDDPLRIRVVSLADLDGDGFAVGDDAFPADPSEWSDRDGDGTGDHSDVFPDDPTEIADRDRDGTGDNGDAFPWDPAEWSDRDGDGTGDNADAFPDDPQEIYDSDGDGVGNNADWLPYDPAEAYDSDGDGVGDNTDAFPLDPEYAYDFDRDGIADPLDATPFGDPFLLLALNGTQRINIFGLGRLEAPLRIEVGLVSGGVFTACAAPGACFFGTHRTLPGRRERYALSLPPEVFEELRGVLEEALARALSEEFDAPALVALEFKVERARFSIKLDGRGEAKLRLRLPYRIRLHNVPLEEEWNGAYVWRVRRPKPVEP